MLPRLPIITLGVFLSVVFNYGSIPRANCSLTHFDTLIVLGTPSLSDGTPSPEQRERVLEAVREYEAGVAPHIIMTGGAAHNHYVEAHSMQLFATSQGVPASAILEEDQAQDTIQNIYFSNLLMQAHNLTSAEVISSPSHLPRAALILAHYTFQWRTRPARWPPEYATAKIAALYWGEARSCWRLTQRGFTSSPYLPRER
jgi:uncharacterized SAM-binding protein YcdF (DUF218 family)